VFRTAPLSIIRSFITVHTAIGICHTGLLTACLQFRPDPARKLSANLYDIYHCCVHSEKNSWWWTEELSETCRVLFQKYIWEISVSGWFYYKILPLIIRTLNVHSGSLNRSKHVTVLSHMNPLHIVPSYYFKIFLTLPNHPWLDYVNGPFPSRFPTRITCEFIFNLIRARRPSHRFDGITQTVSGEQHK